jgi:hypothetical protein
MAGARSGCQDLIRRFPVIHFGCSGYIRTVHGRAESVKARV